MSFDLSGETIRKIFVFGLILFFSVPFGYYYGFTYWGNGFAGATLGFLLGTVLTIIGLFVVSKAAFLFGAVAGERKANFTLREQLESDIQQVRYHKMKKDYNVALSKVDNILEQDPNFPEALFLRAQIVWEGFDNGASAQSNLEKIQKTISDKQSAIFRWSCSLSEEIKNKTKN